MKKKIEKPGVTIPEFMFDKPHTEIISVYDNMVTL